MVNFLVCFSRSKIRWNGLIKTVVGHIGLDVGYNMTTTKTTD